MKRLSSWLLYLSVVGLPVWGWFVLKQIGRERIQSDFSESAFLAFGIAITAQAYRETQSEKIKHLCHSLGAFFVLMLAYVWITGVQFNEQNMALVVACLSGFIISLFVSFKTYKS